MEKRRMIRVIWGVLLIALVSFPIDLIAQKDKVDNYLPKGFRRIQIGMALENFEKIKRPDDWEKKDVDGAKVYIEKVERSKTRKQVEYQFDQQQRLVEVIITYNDDVKLDPILVDRYGLHNDGDEWLFEHDDQVSVKVWREGQELHVSDAAFF